MKQTILLLINCCMLAGLYAQGGIQFTSSDTSLQTAFSRAKEMALHYKGKPHDPVGPWYESALPPRYAFCMRDVSHQCIGGEILGLHKENKNMFTLFVKNISANKNWCSYWEMNRLGKPAPEDYRNDKEFWYNLNANFDLLNACWKLYLWTGDEEYIIGKGFDNFHNRSVTDYIASWVLGPDSLLTRPAHPNAAVPFNDQDAFHRCRGLPSYSEGVPNIKMGVDLIAAIYRGLLSYAEILKTSGQYKKAELYAKKAKAYQQRLDADWWDHTASLYHTYYSNNNQFGKDEGETFLLWFDGLKDSTKKQKTIQHLLSRNWGIENLSYFPLIMYQNGYANKGYEYMLHLTDPSTERREYPEVSFGVIKGFVEGLMGIDADARFNRVSTLYRSSKETTSTLSNVSLLKTFISITHTGTKRSSLTNTGTKAVTWRARFSGDYTSIYVNNKPASVKKEKDWLGNIISFTDVIVEPGKTVGATASIGQKKDSVITIPFGKNSAIKYSLTAGTYDVVFNGKTTITGAYAVYKEGEKEITSKELGLGEYITATLLDHSRSKGGTILWRHNGMEIRQVFFIDRWNVKNYFWTMLIVNGQNAPAGYISPIAGARVVMDSTGDNRALAVPFDNDMWARFNAQPFQQANFTSSEVTALYNNDNYHGLVIGSVWNKEWKTGITIKTSDPYAVTMTVFGGLADYNITHDKIPHGKVAQSDTRCVSPWILVGAYDDWRMGMEEYAAVNQHYNPQVIANREKATPIGWNSWGSLQTKLTLDKAKGVVDFFSDSCKGFRNADSTLFVDLDSFWDNLVKGGLDGDVSQLKEFVAYCKSKGFKPGIYWAPFTDWGKVDRKMEGSSYNYAQAWTLQNGKPVDMDGALALDPTHPGTKARIAWCLNHFKKLGFEMIKIDFLGHGALESDHFYDPKITTGMQAYRMGMEYVDSVLDNKMLVYAAISPTMATAPYVHIRRIACDAFSAIDNTEYTLNSTSYGWWQSYLYNYVDADHVVFNRESEGANRARLASALVTGTLITGDDYSTHGPWSLAAKRLLQNKALLNVIKDGRSFRPVEANTGNKAVALFVKTVGATTYVAAFNYGNNPCIYNLSSARLGFSQGKKIQATELFSGANNTWNDNMQLTVPPSDAVVYIIYTGNR